MKYLLGYGVLRTYRGNTTGKTFCSYPHTLYPTRQAAEAHREYVLGGAYVHEDTFDVVEVRMLVPQEDE